MRAPFEVKKVLLLILILKFGSVVYGMVDYSGVCIKYPLKSTFLFKPWVRSIYDVKAKNIPWYYKFENRKKNASLN